MDELKEFHEELFNQINANASAGRDFLQRSFFSEICGYLADEANEIEMPEYAYYNTQGRAIDGFYLDETESGNGALNLFLCIYSGENTVSTINKDEVIAGFKRLENFFTKSMDQKFHREMEETSDGYKAAYFIYSHKADITNINLFLLTDKKLSSRTLSAIDSKRSGDKIFNYHLWDLARIHRLVSSEMAPQDIVVDFFEEFGEGLPFLQANVDGDDYKAYLSVVPGRVLALLYEKYGARLLERNVRSFLQVKGKVNKGIRETILKCPKKFFAYNNGITATAENIEFENDKIKSLTNLQIVNGGQTTASLFNAYKKDNKDLSDVFVQMKLSVVSQDVADEMVPDISRFANSQNKVSDSDFYSTHPFHKRMEEFSRKILVPPVPGQIVQPKWFYERSRGQYANSCAYKTPAEKKKFQLEYPKNHLFTKTDLAKFEGVWMKLPNIVSKGAQYICSEFSKYIKDAWKKDNTVFNSAYYKIAVSKAIIFKTAENIVTNSSWYDGGYRANIVAYTLSFIAHKVEMLQKSVDFMKIWNEQKVSEEFARNISIIAQLVHGKLINNGLMSNVGQYCKQEMCWESIKNIDIDLTSGFVSELVEANAETQALNSERGGQKMDNQITDEIEVVNIGEANWRKVYDFAIARRLITMKEKNILEYYFRYKYASASQSKILLGVLDRMKREGLVIE